MTATPVLEQLIREQAAKLDTFYDQIVSCHVMVGVTHRRIPTAAGFHVRIDLTVPGGELYVGREPGSPRDHEDVYAAVREAFRQMRRRLQEYGERQRGELKAQADDEQEHARVRVYFPQRGYGFLETVDGRDVYFHRNAVLEGAHEIRVGQEVRFHEVPANDGMQASTVSIVGREGQHAMPPIRYASVK